MFIYRVQPVDWWDGAVVADSVTTAKILEMMPEQPRTQDVYIIRFPHESEMKEVYLCKAENNGTVYVFAEFDIIDSFEDFELYQVNEGRIKL